MLKIAIPNKGALSETTVDIIKKAGYKCQIYGKELVVRDSEHDIDFYFLRPRDIAVYIGNGILDLGITGRDLSVDSKAKYEEILPLNFGNSKFFYAVPNDSTLTVDKLNGKQIATAYPTIIEQDMKKRGFNFEIIKLDGAVEISVELGVADAIADVVESGRTLMEAGLKTIGEPIMESEAIIIAKNKNKLNEQTAKIFVKRIESVIIAKQFVMVEYDISKENIHKATKLTPGIESPTISPLNENGWFAVKAMVKFKGVNKLLDDLHDTGAKGIIVSEIKTCRL
ncbi:MAG: ATP phosphoribosyltransferase [Chitinispirillales bacterium]|jgi:ATP phosphoribosyltransferase|nr:ATP phosphoribosyltransferase [Chitinispirillales bacterium]